MKKIKTKAPGRINIIGEHTDYNNGFVLPAAIDRYIYQNISLKEDSSLCQLHSEHYDEFIQFNLNDIKHSEKGWANYLLGVVSELRARGHHMTGFDCKFGGDIPIGGGVSSSSALQVSFILALNNLFDLKLSKIQMAQICQDADHNFIGMKGGMMDQFTILHGQKDKVILLDCETLDYKYIPCELGQYEFVVLNTNVAHNLATSEYNIRREQCEKGLEIINSSSVQHASLRQVNMAKLLESKHHMPEILFKRCWHVISENERTLNAAKALQSHLYSELGILMYASHESLSSHYDVSCDELDFIVNYSIDKPYVLGCRMMGGGFGGCTIALVLKEKKQEFIDGISLAYIKRFSLDLGILNIVIEEGAKVI